jgi:hypothetical protein
MALGSNLIRGDPKIDIDDFFFIFYQKNTNFYLFIYWISYFFGIFFVIFFFF